MDRRSSDHSVLSEECLTKLAEHVKICTGLFFPRARWSDLSRGMRGIARDFGFGDVEACAQWLLNSTPSGQQAEVLARHLTVGETYFFREPALFETLRHEVLSALVSARRASGLKQLRLWSVGCATGEEAYSLAILLELAIPDLHDWNVHILGTDINTSFLRAAERGVFRAWSFRNMPLFLKNRFFRPSPNGLHEIDPRIRTRVTFAHQNLADVSSWPLGPAVDLILCRNVLMYLEPFLADAVLSRLAGGLREDGWLAVGTAESCRSRTPELEPITSKGVIVYRKKTSRVTPHRSVASGAPADSAASAAGASPSRADTAGVERAERHAAARELFHSGRYVEAIQAAAECLKFDPDDVQAAALLARSHANRGALDEALAWTYRVLAFEKADADMHVLQATILLELGRSREALTALDRALFLAPDYALAHYTRGVLSFGEGNHARACREMDATLGILARSDPATIIPETDGLTAGRLAEFAVAMRELAGRGAEA